MAMQHVEDDLECWISLGNDRGAMILEDENWPWYSRFIAERKSLHRLLLPLFPTLPKQFRGTL